MIRLVLYNYNGACGKISTYLGTDLGESTARSILPHATLYGA